MMPNVEKPYLRENFSILMLAFLNLLPKPKENPTLA